MMRLRALALVALAPWAGAAAEKGIQDNSFFIEEAYNQEEGVVQHITTFQRERRSRSWELGFTQEWPLAGIRHQFSYSIPATRPEGSRAGMGDASVDYRYQLVGDGDAALAIAPRLGVSLPTGKWRQGRGSGAAGYEAQVPVSVVLGERLAAHTNVGYARTPRARDADGNRADASEATLGQSLVWLVHPRVNLLLEAVHSRAREVSGPGTTERVSRTVVSPGVRWSYDFDSGLQVVPGLAFPIGRGAARGERGVFLYLSFEHPFKRGA